MRLASSPTCPSSDSSDFIFSMLLLFSRTNRFISDTSSAVSSGDGRVRFLPRFSGISDSSIIPYSSFDSALRSTLR